MDVQQRIANLENEIARLQEEAKRLDRRMANMWNTAMSQRRIGDVLGPVLAFPVLRGVWLMSSCVPGGNLKDLSGQDRDLTAVDPNGNPHYGEDAFLPYFELSGTSYLSRADETALDVQGDESEVLLEHRGLTLGVVAYFYTTASAEEAILTKGGGGVSDTAYWLSRDASGYPKFVVGDGAAWQGATATATVGATTWVSLIGRFDPSTEISLFVNDVEYTDTSSIPATLLDSSNALNIGSYNDGAGLFLDGRVALAWICAANIRDAVLMKYYGRLKPFLG